MEDYEDYTCHCGSCKGCTNLLKWQCQILCQGEHNAWKNIVMWEEGCCLLCIMSHAIWTYREIALEGEQQNVDSRVEYEELRCHTNVENQARFNSLLGATWK